MTDNHPRLPSPKYGPDTTVDEDEDPRGAWSYDQVRAAIDAALAARGAVPAGWRELLAQSRENFRRNFGSQGLGIWVYEDIEELLAEAEAAPQQVAQPVQPTLLRDLAEELGMSVPALAGAISRKGLGYYSPNMEVTNDVIGAMRADFAQAKPEQAAQPLTDEETAIDLLAEVFDAYENGTPCYEEPDEHSGFVGNAFVLGNETFHACADLLNRRRPVAEAPKKPKD